MRPAFSIRVGIYHQIQSAQKIQQIFLIYAISQISSAVQSSTHGGQTVGCDCKPCHEDPGPSGLVTHETCHVYETIDDAVDTQIYGRSRPSRRQKGWLLGVHAAMTLCVNGLQCQRHGLAM